MMDDVVLALEDFKQGGPALRAWWDAARSHHHLMGGLSRDRSRCSGPPMERDP